MDEFLLLITNYIENRIDEKELQEHLHKICPNIYDYNEKLIYARINKTIFQNKNFKLTTSAYREVHRLIFKNILEEAGNYRDANLTRKEPCIDGHSVIYTPYYAIERNLEYDFSEERNKHYSKNNQTDMYKSLLHFASNIWQCHPFYNGNTRTCAIYLQKYLKTKGIIMSNTSFKNNALYFRNALVRSNYSTNLSIDPTYEYLDKFFYSILEKPDIILDVNETYEIKPKNLTRS